MICWLDMETDGLARDCVVLELGWVLTTDDLEVVKEGSAVRGKLLDVESLRDRADEVVRQMHDDNGLWDEVRASDLWAHDVYGALVEDLDTFVPEGELIVPGGTGVARFDLNLLQRDAPALYEWFTYWTYDTGVPRRMAQRAGVPRWEDDPERPAHRALGDARAALEEWRWYESTWRAAWTPPS